MDFNFRDITPYELRLKYFEDSDIVSRIDKAKASVLSPKAKDCQRQLNEASSVWAVDKRKFIFIFSDINEEGKQKVSVWGQKAPGDYQRIKTLWVSCHDYIFEAVAMFLTDYFELFILKQTYSSDVSMLHDIEYKIKEVLRYTPSNMKQKIKLLKQWNDIIPSFNKVMSDLDERIAMSLAPKPVKNKTRMKTFLQDKGATYNAGDHFSLAVRKDCIEYYIKLKKGHAVANVEIYCDAVRITIACKQFADQFFGKAIMEGIDVERHPKLDELISSNKYTILTDRTGEKAETRIFLDIERSFPDWLEAIADKEVRMEIEEMVHFFLDIYNELVKSPSPTFKALAKNFYD
ncbi:MAG: hypothetical protein K2K75_11555 [Muribaculaceae bacterium]|nr:hypothetical protein [Muribaculaceae bacterium]